MRLGVIIISYSFSPGTCTVSSANYNAVVVLNGFFIRPSPRLCRVVAKCPCEFGSSCSAVKTILADRKFCGTRKNRSASARCKTKPPLARSISFWFFIRLCHCFSLYFRESRRRCVRFSSHTLLLFLLKYTLQTRVQYFITQEIPIYDHVNCNCNTHRQQNDVTRTVFYDV